MSIEKNIETLANNSDRIAGALEGILAELVYANGRGVGALTATTAASAPPGVTSDKGTENTSEADAKAAAKAEKAAAAKAAKEAADKAAKEAADKAAVSKGGAVSYDSIKAVVTELAGKGPDGITAIKGVLGGYGASKASDVPEEKWTELLAAFEKVKAELEGSGGFA